MNAVCCAPVWGGSVWHLRAPCLLLHHNATWPISGRCWAQLQGRCWRSALSGVLPRLWMSRGWCQEVCGCGRGREEFACSTLFLLRGLVRQAVSGLLSAAMHSACMCASPLVSGIQLFVFESQAAVQGVQTCCAPLCLVCHWPDEWPCLLEGLCCQHKACLPALFACLPSSSVVYRTVRLCGTRKCVRHPIVHGALQWCCHSISS